MVDLYIGLEGSNTGIINQILNDFPNANISYHKNAGADILSFLEQLDGLPNVYSHDIFLKLHSKKSNVHKNVYWRQMLLESYIGNRKKFINNIKQFNYPNTGAVCNTTFLLDNQEFTNTDKIKYLCKDVLNIEYDKINHKQFFAGTMFFGKTSLFKSCFCQPLVYDKLRDLLGNEIGKVDDLISGTFSHSLERIFGYIVSVEKYRIRSTIEPSIRIINPAAPNHKFHVVKLYNGYCYLKENPVVFGEIRSTKENDLTILWHHLDRPVLQAYYSVGPNTWIKIDHIK